MSAKIESPKIVDVSWGKIEVQGLGMTKDVKLFPGGGREWDWNETGTRHVPGIQVADIQELIEQDSEIIVLSRGMQLILQTCPETIAFLRDSGIEVHVEETTAAVAVYNRLASEGLPVGGLFHSTC